MAVAAILFTIARVSEMLEADEELLWELATEMGPEDGCLWVFGTGEEQTIAFTDHGVERLRELLSEHRPADQSPRSPA